MVSLSSIFMTSLDLPESFKFIYNLFWGFFLVLGCIGVANDGEKNFLECLGFLKDNFGSIFSHPLSGMMIVQLLSTLFLLI